MTKTQQLRRRLTILLAVLGLLDAALLVYLLAPRASGAHQRAQEEALQQEFRSKTREVAPLQGIEEKLVKSRTDLKSLYQEQLARDYSQISEEVYRLAKDNGVSYPSLMYKPEIADLPGVQRISINTTISADYAKIPRFINAMERDKHLLLVIDQISVKEEQGGVVALQIRFEAYLRTTT
jgi:Tfp pilus assembly protein PilO